MSVKHTIRDLKGGTVELNLTPRKAIKRFCLECMCGVRSEIDRCTAPLCPLYPFRLGDAHNFSEDTLKAMAERGKKSTFGQRTTISTPPPGQDEI